MNCQNHPDRITFAQCSACGKNLCTECAIEKDGKYYCRQCLGISTGFRSASLDISSSRLILPALGFGLLAGILSSVPVLSMLNCVFCLWVVLCGGLAVYLVKRRDNISGKITSMKAGLTGAITGCVAGIITVIPIILSPESVVTAMQEIMNQPELQGLLEGAGATFEESMSQFIVLAVILNVILFMVFGALGGIISNEVTK